MDATAGTMPQPAWPFQARKRSPRLPLAGAFLLIAGLLLLACGGGADDAPPAAPTPAATTPAPSPAAAAEEDAAAESAADAPLLSTGDAQIGPAADAPASLETEPLVWLVPAEARQGSAFLVAVDAPGAGFASVAFEGQVFTLLREGDRFFTILGIDALTPVGPLPVVIAVADAAGRPVLQQEALISVAPANWQTEVVELDESNQALLDPAVLAEDEATRHPQFRTETPERHWDGIFDPPSNGVITSSYGLLRSYNFLPPSEYHEGIDFAGANGDPVLAPNAGVVAWVGQTSRRGNGIILDHGGGLFSGYYHLSEVVVAPGEVVNTGDFIGRIGATGLATGPHLHWEVVVHGVPVDPVQWLRSTEFPDPLAEFEPVLALRAPNQRAG